MLLVRRKAGKIGVIYEPQPRPSFTNFLQLIKKECNILVWKGPAGLTDVYQPVDQGAGRAFKVEYASA